MTTQHSAPAEHQNQLQASQDSGLGGRLQNLAGELAQRGEVLADTSRPAVSMDALGRTGLFSGDNSDEEGLNKIDTGRNGAGQQAVPDQAAALKQQELEAARSRTAASRLLDAAAGVASVTIHGKPRTEPGLYGTRRMPPADEPVETAPANWGDTDKKDVRGHRWNPKHQG